MSESPLDPLKKRQDYGSLALEEGSLLPNPLEQLTVWVTEADEAEMSTSLTPWCSPLLTPTENPSSRTVLLRRGIR